MFFFLKIRKAARHTLLREHRCKRSSQRNPATKERIPVGRNETALQPYSHSQPLRAHSGIVLKINIFHVEKGRSPYPASRAQTQRKLAMTGSAVNEPVFLFSAQELLQPGKEQLENHHQVIEPIEEEEMLASKVLAIVQVIRAVPLENGVIWMGF